MKKLASLIVFLCGGVCALPTGAARAAESASDQEKRLAALRAQVVSATTAADREMALPNPEPEVRHLATAGWCHLALGDDPKKGEQYLKQVLDSQYMDPAKPDYGTFPWHIGRSTIQDANAVDFAVSFLTPPMLRYPQELSEHFKRDAQPHLKAAIEGERHHDVPVTYGNIYLMKLSNLIMLGELTGDSSAVAEGKANLVKWLEWTRINGDNEYDSPTYAPVQLTGLENVYLNPPDEATKALAKAGLDYLWSDLAANYFAPRDSVGGPHSRSYDFLYQRGTIQHHYYLEGLSPELSGKEYLGGVWLNAMRPGAYHPGPSVLALARLPERTVIQRYGAEPGRDRYNRVTPDYDIGSTSTYYGPQDEQISVEFATNKKLPVTWIVLDSIDAPFGKQSFKDKSGHDKPKHLRDVLAAVQSGSSVLALHDLAPDLAHGKYESVATNIILPVEADAIYLDDTKLPAGQIGHSFEQAASKDSVVFVREGKTAAAFRIFDASALENQTPHFAVKYDGNEWGAGRLVVYHYSGKSTGFGQGTTALAGVYLNAERCDSDQAFEDFRKRMHGLKIESKRDGKEWSASVEVDGTKLETALDLSNHSIAYRRVGGQNVLPHPLTVNDKDLAAEVLDPLKLEPISAATSR